MSAAGAISAYYFFFFGALGTFLPYFPRWLVEQGLPVGEVTRVLSLTPLMGLFAPPLFGMVADAQRARLPLLRLASVAAALAFSGLWACRQGAPMIALVALFAFARAPLTSLIDATALDHIRHHGGSYGRLRLWGSAGFLVFALAVGVAVERWGIGTVVLVTGGALGAAVVCTSALPALAPIAQGRPVTRAWLELIADPRWWVFLSAVMLAQMATATYDSGFSLHLARLGYDGRFTGLAWSVGVAAEIGLMACSGAVLERIAPAPLFAFTILVAAIRWECLAHAHTALAILLLQPLHGVTFGLFWVSAMRLVRERGRLVPTSAQGMFAAATGTGSLVGMSFAGRLLERGGGVRLYGTASVIALLAAALAIAYARWIGEQATA